jgi:glycosyltransferase involved in cell wall biosynthesis
MAQYAVPVAGLPKVLDMHNIESLLLRRYARAYRPSPRSLYAALTAWKLRRYEVRHVQGFDRVLTCSEVDRRYAVEVLGCPSAQVIPNGVDAAGPWPARDLDAPPSLVFVGRMDYVANEDAAIRLATEILPIVWHTHPQVRLYLVGQQPPPRLQALAADPRIIVTGFVPEVRTFLDRATVFVAPLRYGSGTRLKLLEAMAMARPVVSTSLGCEGLDLRPGEHLLVADSPTAFAGAVVSLLRCPASRARLGRAAREHVARRYDWSAIQARLLEVYDALCPRRSPEPMTAGA